MRNIIFYGNSSSFGGAEVYLATLVTGYASLGNKVVVVSRNKNYLAVLSGKINHHSLVEYKWILSFFEFYKFFRDIRDKSGCSIHFNMQHSLACMWELALVAASGIKNIFITIHVVKKPRKWFLSLVLLRGLLRLNPIFICVSKKSAEEFCRNFFIPKRLVRVVYNGISQIYSATFERGHVTNFRDEKIRVLGVVSRLEKGKGVEQVLDAFKKLQVEYPYLKLKIAGCGSYKKRLEKLRGSWGLEEKVFFDGFVDAPDEYISSLDVLISPSFDETFGLSTAEALCLGKPVVVTRQSGITELLTDRVDCLIVEAGRPEEIYNSVRALIIDADFRKKNFTRCH